MMADTDAEEETVGGEEHEGGYGESESEHEDDWDDAFFIPDSDYSQYFLDKSSDKRFYLTYFVRYPFGFYARQLCYRRVHLCVRLWFKLKANKRRISNVYFTLKFGGE